MRLRVAKKVLRLGDWGLQAREYRGSTHDRAGRRDSRYMTRLGMHRGTLHANANTGRLGRWDYSMTPWPSTAAGRG